MADLYALEIDLRKRRDAGRKLLVPYVTGGLGDDWTEVVRAFAAAGADAVQLVVDPIVPASVEWLGDVLAALGDGVVTA